MAATPQYGVASFIGLRSRKTYSKDMYLSDVAAASLRFDEGSGASSTSETFWTAPEPVVLRDVAIHTGTADTTMFQLTVNGNPTGDVVRYAAHLDSLNQRPALNIPIGAGARISGIQRA